MKRIIHLLTITLISLVFTDFCGGKVSADESIEKGLWAVWLGDPFPGYLSDAEKQKMLDIGTTYLVACIPITSVYMDFCDSTGGTITMNIEGPDDLTGLPQTSLWLYIRGTPNPDTAVITQYIQRIYNEYGNHIGFKTYMVMHETAAFDSNKNFAMEYACKQIHAIDPNPNHYSLVVAPISILNTNPNFFDAVLDLDIFEMDWYPFYYNTPYEGTGFQQALDGLITSYQTCKNITDTRKVVWHAVIQTFGHGDPATTAWRLPTRQEISCQAYLALTRGAKGVVIFSYGSKLPPGESIYGLLTPSREIAHYDSRPGDTDMYEDVRDLFDVLDSIGYIMHRVKSLLAFNSQNIPAESYIDSVKGDEIINGKGTVEIGTFVDTTLSPQVEYFMLVNRKCLETEGANYDVFVTKTGGPYQIRDMYTDSVVGSVSGTGNYFTIYLGPGEGKLLRLESGEHGPVLFMPPVNYAGFPGAITDIVAADFDADGDSDLAVANVHPKIPWTLSVVTILKNRGDGAFDTTGTYSAGQCVQSLFPADYDRDGDKDLAVGHFGRCSNNTIFILENNGTGAFPYSESFETHLPLAVCSADFDKDGDPDLAATTWNWDSVAVLLNNGYGWLGPVVYYYTGGTYANCLYAADFNGDTYPDLAIPNYGSQNLSILINNGNATFQAPINYYLGNKPWSICGADFDNDGDCDLAIANYGQYDPHIDPSISIFKNNGDGTFYLTNNYVISQAPTDIVTADFDLDGDFDLAFTCGTSDSLFVWLNSGDGTFQPAEAYSLGGSSGPLVASDLNGDGAPDLAVARGYNKNDVAILINLSTNLPPNPFSLISPPNNDTILPINSYAYVDFDWQETFDPEGDSVWYSLYISQSPSFHPESTIIHVNLLQAYYSDSLQAGTYFWKVKASDKWGAPRWSNQTWRFHTYLCGDVNCDGVVNIQDIVYLINYKYLVPPGPPPNCPDVGR